MTRARLRRSSLYIRRTLFSATAAHRPTAPSQRVFSRPLLVKLVAKRESASFFSFLYVPHGSLLFNRAALRSVYSPRFEARSLVLITRGEPTGQARCTRQRVANSTNVEGIPRGAGIIFMSSDPGGRHFALFSLSLSSATAQEIIPII